MDLKARESYQQILERSDEQLCNLASGGSRTAEEILVTRYARLVRAVTRPYFLAGGDSDDLIQEGMVGLMKAVREFDSSKEASFRTFAEVCIRNRIYSVLRSANREKHSPLNQSISIETPFFDTNPFVTGAYHAMLNPEDLLIVREDTAALRQRAESQLSHFEKRVLTLYLEGLTQREIAQEVQKPPKSVENAVQRIRRKVARQLISGDVSQC